jgi:hypothetical protein
MSIEIDKISDDVVEITLNGWVYNIDDSLGAKTVERWPANDDESSDMERDNYMCEWVEYGHNVPEKDEPIEFTEEEKITWRTVESTLGQSEGAKALLANYYNLKAKGLA